MVSRKIAWNYWLFHYYTLHERDKDQQYSKRQKIHWRSFFGLKCSRYGRRHRKVCKRHRLVRSRVPTIKCTTSGRCQCYTSWESIYQFAAFLVKSGRSVGPVRRVTEGNAVGTGGCTSQSGKCTTVGTPSKTWFNGGQKGCYDIIDGNDWRHTAWFLQHPRSCSLSQGTNCACASGPCASGPCFDILT